MNRRTFNKLASFAAVAALTDNIEMNAEEAAVMAGEVILQDDNLLVAFDPGTGALVRMERKSTRWPVQRRPAFGVSFRMLAPLPDRRDNEILGQKQRAARVQKTGPNQVQIVWKDPVSEHGGVVPLTLTATATLRNGTLSFETTLENRSPLTIETIDYPYFGDLNAPARESNLHTEHMWYGNLVRDEIYPGFRNAKGYWGVLYPTKTIGTNRSLFCLLQGPDQGIYVGMHDATVPYYLEFTFEQHPGVIQSIASNVPRADEISGIPVHLDFRTCHFVFVHPGSTRKLAPIVMRAYDGDWHAGVDVYKEWRATWYKTPHLPDWINDVHSWLQLQIDGAEEDFRVPYRELSQYGFECADNGVGAIQLVGWHHGGQDRGDPALDTDPGLGTWQELHDAIAKIQARGVKMILFGKPIWADRTTEWYKTELYKYECTDPFGLPYEQGGYSYTTTTQLAGINNRRRSVMDVNSQKYRDVATHEFEKILKLGAQGWLFDEVCHHGGTLYNFSASHGYNPPGYVYAGDMPMAAQFRAAADKVNPNFIFAGEAPQDWLMQYYPVSYFRIGADSRAVCRYIDPQAPLMVAVTGIDDREMLNLILAYRYIISYEPYNFKGHVTDFPMTLAYGKKIDALRRRYKAWLWDAEFRDTLGAIVSADGSHRYTVFRTGAGKRAVVIVNHEYSKTISAKLDLENPGTLMYASPEEPEAKSISGALRIPARSVVAVMEQ